MPLAQPRRRQRITTLGCVVAVATAAVALSGCGGSSSPSASTPPKGTTQQATPTPVPSNADIGAAKVQAERNHADKSAAATERAIASDRPRPAGHQSHPRIVAAGKVQKARPTGAPSDHDASTTGPSSLNPCALVSVGEAKTITGGTVSSSFEAPLGPTCVYKAARPRTDITVDVEAVSLAQAASHMTKRKQLTVGGHRAYCGMLGSQMLFVPLAGGKLLHVTAPCALAQQFATLALGRLAA